MKYCMLCLAFLLMSLNSIWAQGLNNLLDREISLSLNKVSIKEALELISEKTGLNLSYSKESIDLSRRVTIDIDQKSVKEALKLLFPLGAVSYQLIGENLMLYKSDDKPQKPQSYTISGYVNESGSSEYMPGATVYIPELKTGVATNNYGFFSITIPKGRYALIVSHLGYSQVSQKLEVSKDTSLKVLLSPQQTALEEVVVSANAMTGQPSEIIQMSQASITQDEVWDIPALLGERDATRALQLLPGIKGGNEGSTGLLVRGGNRGENHIILDDATVYNNNHFFGYFSVFHPDAIKSVETLRGGFPARYGGRLSSIVRVHSKDGNKQQVTGRFNLGLITSSLSIDGPIKKEKTSFAFNARRSYLDLLIAPAVKEIAQTLGGDSKLAFALTDLNFKVHHVFNEKNKIFWSNYYGNDNFLLEGKSRLGRLKSQLTWGNKASTLRWNHQFNHKLFANFSLVYSDYEFSVIDEDEFSGEKFELEASSRINDWGVKADFEYYPNPNHLVRWGITSTKHQLLPKMLDIQETGTPDINVEESLRSVESAIYVEDDWRLSEKWRIQPGFRLSHFVFEGKQYLNPEPRFAVAMNPQPNLAFKASFASMYQYIHLLTNTGIALPSDLWVSSTENVGPQQSWQVALGMDKDMQSVPLTLSVEGYFKKSNDLIDYSERASFLNIEDLQSARNLDWENNITLGQGWAYGAEVLLRKQKGQFTGWLGYTLSWSERQFDELNQGRKFYDTFDQRHDLSVVGMYKTKKKQRRKNSGLGINWITLSSTWVFNSPRRFTIANLKTQAPNDLLFPDSGQNNEQPLALVSERNNIRGEAYHRLDLGIQFHRQKDNGTERIWGLSVYNAYARKNPYLYRAVESGIERLSYATFIPAINYSKTF